MKRRGFLAALIAVAAAPLAAARGQESMVCFGAGTPALLHGFEEVIPVAELERRLARLAAAGADIPTVLNGWAR